MPGLSSWWIALPENRAAGMAVERVAEAVCAGQVSDALNPLFLHGPTGSGKSRLATLLVEQVTQQAPATIVSLLDGGDLTAGRVGSDTEDLIDARRADLLIVEDLHQLAEGAFETFVSLVDRGLARRQQQVFTASAGPAQLTHLPARLTSRLARGLVVGLSQLSPVSRRVFLEQRAQERGLVVDEDALAWLAGHLPGSTRVLEGALTRLETLARLEGKTPALEAVAEHFWTEAQTSRLTAERIVQRVGRYFQVEPRRLQSRARSPGTLLPRQVGMYLIRQLTDLSLQQIGDYFGGRDHSTVLHACRKVERALAADVPLSQAVRQLHMDLA
jgi:chromosomal replication initiator protein